MPPNCECSEAAVSTTPSSAARVNVVAVLYMSRPAPGYVSVCASMCRTTRPGWRFWTARSWGSVTLPSPPIVTGTTPASTMAPTASSIRSKASST